MLKKTFQPSDELTELGQKVIKERKLDTGKAKLDYVLVYPNISKTTAGRCIRCNNELQYYSEADFIVEMSGELWDNLDEKRKYILMYHEVKHVKAVYNEKKGEWKYSIRPHDVEDFADIIREFGVEWIGEIKTIIASINDLDPEEVDSITL